MTTEMEEESMLFLAFNREELLAWWNKALFGSWKRAHMLLMVVEEEEELLVFARKTDDDDDASKW